MRPRIQTKVDLYSVINEIEHRIDVKKQLLRLTMRQENCGFREAKNLIKWELIKKEVKQLNN